MYLRFWKSEWNASVDHTLEAHATLRIPTPSKNLSFEPDPAGFSIGCHDTAEINTVAGNADGKNL